MSRSAKPAVRAKRAATHSPATRSRRASQEGPRRPNRAAAPARPAAAPRRPSAPTPSTAPASPFDGAVFSTLRELAARFAAANLYLESPASGPRALATVAIFHALRALVAMLDGWGSPAAEQTRTLAAALDNPRGVVLYNPHPNAPPVMTVEGRLDPDADLLALGLPARHDFREPWTLPTAVLLAMSLGNGDEDPVVSILEGVAIDLANLAQARRDEVMTTSDEQIDATLWAAERRALAASELHRRMRTTWRAPLLPSTSPAGASPEVPR